MLRVVLFMTSSLHHHVLRRAAGILGGKEQLRVRLRVSMRELDAWLNGTRPPIYIFLAAVDVISAANGADGMHLRSPAVSLLAEDFASSETRAMLEEALGLAMKETGAARGNVQLAFPEGLRIVASLGFEQPFLDFFAVVKHDTPSTCGLAHEGARRVVVEDVLASPIFAGTAAAEIMAQGGALACQSTPLLDDTSRVIGMLNTHYDRPHRPSARELELIDLVARRASHRLAQARA